jgi:hypothetical protein
LKYSTISNVCGIIVVKGQICHDQVLIIAFYQNICSILVYDMHGSKNPDFSSQIQICCIDFFSFHLNSTVVSVTEYENQSMSLCSWIDVLININEVHKSVARIIPEREPKSDVTTPVEPD